MGLMSSMLVSNAAVDMYNFRFSDSKDYRKSLKIPKGQSEALSRRSDKTMKNEVKQHGRATPVTNPVIS
jgi:hypothetical protein